MKKLALLAALAAATNAFASFDLALVLQDVAIPNGPTLPGISRWDPVNRVQLGSFTAAGFASNTKLMLDPSNPGVLVGASVSAGIFRLNSYDYSTGNYLGQTNPVISINALTSADMLAGGSMLLTGNLSGSPFARIFTSTGSLTRNYTLPSGTLEVMDAHLGADGVAHVLSRQAGTTSGNKFTLTSHAPNSSAIVQSLLLSDNITGEYTNIVRQGNTLAIGFSTLSSRRIVPVSGTSLGTPFTTGGWVVSTTKIVGGHGNMIHGFGYNSTETRTYISTAIIDSAVGGTYFYNSSTAFGNVFDAVVVVAPEPGTLLALGVGVSAMLRRRRNRK